MNTRIIHVVHDPAFGGFLKSALIPDGLVLVLPDKLSFGPLLEDKESLSILAGRADFWARNYSNIGTTDLNQDYLLSCEKELTNAKEVIFYVGPGLDEKLFYIVAYQIFCNLNAPIQKFNYVDLSTPPGSGFLIASPGKNSIVDSVKHSLKEIKAVDRLEKDFLSRNYELLLNDDPQASNDFNQQCPGSPCSGLAKALKLRYPERFNGLNQLQYGLLESCLYSGPKLSLILGDLIADNEKIDRCPDLILKEMIIKFASDGLRRPLLALDGDPSGFKLDVFVTEFGNAVLAGEENHSEINGIDNWIGGVHLESEYGSPWYYDSASQELVRS